MRIFLLFCFCFSCAPRAETGIAQTVEEIRGRIVVAANRTIERFQSDAAAWTTAIELQEGASRAIVDYQYEPARRSITITAEANGLTEEILRIVERDGLWYVTEPDRRYKSRPFEAPFALPSAYHLLITGELRVCDILPEPGVLGEFDSIDGATALFRTQLPPAKLAQLKALLPMFEQALKAKSVDTESVKKQQAAVEHLIANGVTTGINLEHGYLAAGGAPGKRQLVIKFQWLSAADPSAFDVSGVDWEDLTAPLITEGSPNDDFAMMSYCRAWQPGAPGYDTDAVLLNVKTGQLRRIPFEHGICLPGCFSLDRSKVFVVGVVSVEGQGDLFEIDLLTGENRRLTEGQIHGLPLFPALSPDGKTLAVLEAAPGMNTGDDDDLSAALKSRIFLIDVQTGAATVLGQPIDTAYLSWLPDASGLLLITRKHKDMNSPSIDSIARLNLDGSLHEICPGSSPCLVLNKTRVLFQERDGDRWFTCDLNGKNTRLLGDGLAKFGFPAPSPDGDRLMMMRFGQPAGPKPYIVDVKTGAASPIPVGGGLWATPRWQ